MPNRDKKITLKKLLEKYGKSIIEGEDNGKGRKKSDLFNSRLVPEGVFCGGL